MLRQVVRDPMTSALAIREHALVILRHPVSSHTVFRRLTSAILGPYHHSPRRLPLYQNTNAGV